MPSASRPQRLFHLVSLLHTYPGITSTRLQQRLGISERTLFRDLEELPRLGVRVVKDDTEGYRLREPEATPDLTVTADHYLALRLVMKWAETALDSPLFRRGLAAIDRILARVERPDEAETIDRVVEEAITVAARDGARPQDDGRWFEPLFQAVRDRRICRIRYQPAGGQPEQDLVYRPYQLHHWRDAWYTIGLSEDHGEERMLKLVRIRRLVPDDRTFERPAGYTSSRYLGEAWSLVPGSDRIRVRLRFSPLVAQNVQEVRWHPSQEAFLRPDGRLDVHFMVSGTSEILWWVLGYGDEVEVLDPPQLRMRVVDTARRMLERYGALDRGPSLPLGVTGSAAGAGRSGWSDPEFRPSAAESRPRATQSLGLGLTPANRSVGGAEDAAARRPAPSSEHGDHDRDLGPEAGQRSAR